MSKKSGSLRNELTAEQFQALELMQSGENIFLTGGAGSGKSYVTRCFMEDMNSKDFPILASTGTAAVLVGGRTFHGFFGLGIMEGGPEKTFEKASLDARLMKRLRQVEGVIIDEVSMISSQALETAESLARHARNNTLPWGGLRVICVGDFSQLPPVSSEKIKPWAFLSSAWKNSGFIPFQLHHNQRVQENLFLDVLADVRQGKVTDQVRQFLNSKLQKHDPTDTAPRLFPRRAQAESFNQMRLQQLTGEMFESASIYLGLEKQIETLKKMSPVPDLLQLKEGASVMFLQNDPQRRWVNGTRGTVVQCEPDKIIVEKLHGRDVTVEKSSFSMLDADGQVIASVINFPLVLSYATTIHKSQGATLDDLWVDLRSLWEPGQAYVALSRLRTSQGLKLTSWTESSIKVDPVVTQFYEEFELAFPSRQ